MYIQNDRLGSGRYASDVTGEIVGFTDLDEWGNVLKKIVPVIGAKQADILNNFTNHEIDMVLGGYYAKARMYDPQDKRFLAQDPIKGNVYDPQSLNTYIYVLNNPLIYVDPLGLTPNLRGPIILDGDASSGIYRIGKPFEPDFSHWRTDDFIYDPNAVPTTEDKESWDAYGNLLRYGRIFTNTPNLLQGSMIWAARTFTDLDTDMAESRRGVDISDALRLYSHYRSGTGKDVNIDLKKAYNQDANIKKFIDAEIANLQKAVATIYFQIIDCENQNRVMFQITGSAVGMKNDFWSYPATENWHKTLGDFLIYLTADVIYDPNTKQAVANITINSLDYYNFNKGAFDAMTGLPDDANGRFVELGWAKPFTTRGRFMKEVRWNF